MRLLSRPQLAGADPLFSVAVIQPGDSSTAGSILSLLVSLLHVKSL